MKRSSSAIAISPTSLRFPKIAKTLLPQYHRKFSKKQTEVPFQVTPPTDEVVNCLNSIGREYPFCVYYKHKMYDPL
jgi:hypothetical protein